jgi:hypothetical protein
MDVHACGSGYGPVASSEQGNVLSVSIKSGKFLTSFVTIVFSRRAPLHGVR